MGTTTTHVGTERAPSAATVDEKLEVVVIPVGDVDRAKRFYEGLGWRLDADFANGDDWRLVQVTPPGSACSVLFGKGFTTAAPGSVQGTFLVVDNLETARADLGKRGVDVSEVFHYAGLNRLDPAARLSGPAPDRSSYGSFVSFSDPDGNGWLLQEITTRLPGRVDASTTAFSSANDLANAMRRASVAHGEHEKRTGQPDANWPDWYAAGIIVIATCDVLS